MGTLHDNLTFTGSLSNLSAFKRRGSDKIILRTKGGPSKRQIKTHPVFEQTRQLNNEWKAVTDAAAAIRGNLHSLKSVADYNTSGPMNALVKNIQIQDQVNPKGRRSILFSKHPDLISHFSFTKNTLLETIIRQPLTADIEKTSGIMVLTLPALQPLINFFPQTRYAYYRIINAAGSLSDRVCDENNKYYSVNENISPYLALDGEWISVNSPQPAKTYTLTPRENDTQVEDRVLLFGAGIQYGMPSADGSIQPVPYAGASRILKVL